MSIFTRMLKKAALFLFAVLIYGCAAAESDFTPFAPPEPLEEDIDRRDEFPEETVKIEKFNENWIAELDVKIQGKTNNETTFISTGTSSGIGSSTAKAFAREGHSLL